MISPATPLLDRPIRDLRSIELRWADGGAPTRHLVMVEDVARFVEATVALHAGPAQNPHNGAPTQRVIEVRVSALVATGPYWWTTPGLGLTASEPGAQILDACGEPSLVWQCPETAALAASTNQPEAP